MVRMRQLGDHRRDLIIEAATDAFHAGDHREGDRIIRKLPRADRDVAVCLRQVENYRSPNGLVARQKSFYYVYKPLEHMWEDKPPTHFVLVSALAVDVDAQRRQETFIFNSNRYGHRTSQEMPGSYQGGRSHTKALRDAGYSTVIPCKGVPLSRASRRKNKRSR
jgi:hypothetical protein